MKIFALFGAGALAVASLTAVPAEAQRGWDHGPRHGYDHGPRGGPGWDRGRGWDRDRGRGWDRGRGHGYRQHYRGHRGGYGRGRVVCRVQRGYYGPVRRCVTVYR